jgi:hypothetical protein
MNAGAYDQPILSFEVRFNITSLTLVLDEKTGPALRCLILSWAIVTLVNERSSYFPELVTPF